MTAPRVEPSITYGQIGTIISLLATALVVSGFYWRTIDDHEKLKTMEVEFDRYKTEIQVLRVELRTVNEKLDDQKEMLKQILTKNNLH